MYGKEHYYCIFRDTNQDEHILRDVYINMCGLDDNVKTYEVVSKKNRKDIKKEDILGVLYVSNPQPSPCTMYTYLGKYRNTYMNYQDNAFYYEGKEVKEKFDLLTSFLVDSYAQALWNYSKNDVVVIDGHEYMIYIILNNNKVIKYEAQQEYFKAYDTLMHILGSNHRNDEME